ncbi:DNRLRE domain-containing protein [Streptomyces sp. JJ38]|uniref:DNRLRE domain-containing protein n=1 Tax=Streptomyces sp. JJ38 TaxID=2738128 RepID=UPI001C591665|nr:DNRLRE domain-containing protein [Streptomyces sp. JJ38]MBW1597815.1 DNRLRE domain-containing protein [Streptomyces sp. JJ38]
MRKPFRLRASALVLAVAAGVLPSPVLAGIAEAAPSTAGEAGDVPKQRSGTAAGRDHAVGAERTDATGRNSADFGELVADGDALPLTDSSAAFTAVEPAVEPVELKAAKATDGGNPSGFVPGLSDEDTTERTATTKEFRNPDGTRTTHTYTEPVHFRAPEGDWQDIDTSLVPAETADRSAAPQTPVDGRDEDRLHVAADDTGLSVAKQGDDPAIAAMAVGDEGHGVAFGLADAEGVGGTVADDTVTYEGIRAEADLAIQAEHGRIKETIVLNSPDAPRTWSFPLELDGLTPKLNENGAVLLSDDGGTVRAVIPSGWMEDSSKSDASGGPALSGDVVYGLEQRSGGGWTLRVTLDDAWLDSPDRVYPVYVDPSVDDVETYGDAFVQDDWPNDNFSGDDELKVGSYDGGGSRAMSYLSFHDIGTTLDNRYIQHVSLGLFNHWSSACDAHEVRVHQVTQSWSVGTVTWNNAPAVKSTPVAKDSFAYGADCGGSRWRVIDLGLDGAELVQGWVDGSVNNYGLSLRASYTDSGAWKRFASRNSANPPYLAVTHSAWGAEYTLGSQSAPLTGHQSGEVDVTVKNLGDFTWEPLGWNELRLGTRVRDYETGELLDAVAFTRLNERLTPGGDDATLRARIPELPPGKYTVTFDMQRLRDQKWMSSEGVPAAAATVTSQDVGPRITDIYPQPGGQVGSLAPALFVDAESIDQWPAGADLDYWFEVCAGTTEAPVDCVNSGWVEHRTWDVPAGKLGWGEQYVWRVKAREATVEGALSPYYPFTTAVEQPAITSHLGGAGAGGREVDPRIGNFTTTDTDATVATVGPALTVTRTYNSRDPRDDNAFGAGWSTRYDMRAEPDGDGSGNVVVTYPSGRQVRFGHNPDGTYAPPYGSFATLTRTAEDGWRLTDKNQTDYVFDAQGRITEVTDFRDRTQTMTYTGDELTTVTATGGRALHLTWADGHVASVTTEAPDAGTEPLTWDYAYSGDRLIQVCGPEDTLGSCTRYTYGDGSHHRTVVRDASPYSYWRLGEGSGAERAESDLLLNRDNHAGTYHDVTLGLPGALQGSPDTAASFNGTSSYVQLPDQLVSDTPYLTVELWFRTMGSGVLFSYQDHTLEENTTGAFTPALYVGTDGKLRGEFWNGSATPITSATPVNDGTWHHAALSAAGNTQTLYLDGVAVGSLSGSISQFDQRFVYLGAGYWNNWPATTGAQGHFAGDIDEAAVYARPLGARTVAEHYASGTTAQQLTEVVRPSGRVHAQVVYDTALDRVSSYTDAHGGTYQLSRHELTGPEARPSSDGEEGVEADPTVTVTLTDPDERTSSYSYDPLQGYRVVAQTDAGGNTATFAYDTGGFLAATTAPDGTVTRLGHDERGNKISQTTCRDAGAEATCHTEYTEYFLDPDDPLDPRNDQVIAHRDARSSDATDTTYLTSYGYNTYGDRVSTTTPATPGFPEGRTVTHTFTDGTETAVGGGTVPAGLLSTTTDARGGTTVREYTATGDVARVTDAAGLVTEYTYDALGREVSSTVISDAHPTGVTTSTRYDGESRVLKTTGPVTTNAVTGEEHQAVTEYTYDADGLTLTESVSDARGNDATRTTTRTYDVHGRLATLADPENGEESYAYDVYGNQTSRTMPTGEQFTYAYTPLGQLAEVTLKGYDDGGGTPADVVLDSYAYDPTGRLAEHTDAMGRTTRHTYYDDGLPAQTTLVGFQDPDGTTRDLVLSERQYDPAGHLVTEITGNGTVTTTYDVDATGRTTAETLDPAGLARRTAYTHDAGGAVLTETHTGAGGTRTERVTYERNVAGDLIRQTVENGTEDLVTTYQVDDRGLVTAETSPLGNATGGDPAAHTTDFTYDVLGRLTESAAAPVTVEEHGAPATVARPATATGYNTFGEVTDARDPNGEVTHTSYDAAGRPVSTTLPAYTPPGTTTPQAATLRSTYDAAGRPVTDTDPLGNVTSYTYDQLGRLTAVTEPAPTEGAEQPVTRYTYDLLGERLSATDPTGARTEATYDELGRQITSTVIERQPSAGVYTTHLTYDDAGNLRSTTSPTGIVTTTDYNAAGQPTSSTDTAGETTTYDYGPTGLPVAVTDPLGRTVRSTHDLAGRVTAVTDLAPDGTELRTRSSSYDAVGNPVAVTNPLGHTVQQTFDAHGRLTELVEPVDAETSVTTTFGYDAAGHRTRLTDGRSNVTWYTFTSRGLPESVIEPATAAHPDAADRTFTTVYDAAGQPVRELQPGGVEQNRTFDALGRIVSVTGAGAEAATGTDTFGYDLAGRVTSVSAPGGTNAYTYDDRGNLLSASGPSGTATFSYDAEGRLTGRTDAAGAATFGYDTAGRLASAADPLTGAVQSYTYDALSRPSAISYGTGSATRAFGYDPLGRLSSDTLKAPDGTTTASIAYTFDEADQLTGKTTTGTAGAGQHTYAYDHAGRLTNWTAPDDTETPYIWDASGNRVTAGTKTATYDERNRLLTADGVTYSWSARGTLLGTTGGPNGDTTAAYDALGRLLTDGTTTYAYDGLGRLVKRGEVTLAYADHSNNAVSTAGELVFRDPAGNPLSTAASDGSGAQAVLADAHGDVTGTFTPSTGTLAGSSAYSPFGNVTDQAGARGSLGYQGEYTDPDTGKVNMHARWYDPSTGAFASRDSWTLNPTPSIQANRYTYGNGSPLSNGDPSGHYAAPIAAGAGAVAVSAGLIDGAIAVSAGAILIGTGFAIWDWASGSSSHSSSATVDWANTNAQSAAASIRAQADHARAAADYAARVTARNSAAAAAAAEAAAIAEGLRNCCSSGNRGNRSGTSSGYGTSPGGGTGVGTLPGAPSGPPLPPPPVNWYQKLKEILQTPFPRPVSGVTVDDEREEFLKDSLTRARKDFGLPLEELRDYFKMDPRATDDESFRGEFRRFVSTWEDQERNCTSGSTSWVYYHPRDELGRATGAAACLHRDSIKVTGRGAKPNAKDTDIVGSDTVRDGRHDPPGYRRGLARGHLIGRQLGGDGKELRNLVPQYPYPNSVVQQKFEGKIAEAVASGERIYYLAVPKYDGDDLIPYQITLYAVGNRGTDEALPVKNQPRNP